MRTQWLALAVMTGLLAAGCTAEKAATPARALNAVAPSVPTMRELAGRTSSAIAAYPDRGALFTIDSQAAPIRRGNTVWQPVDVSEAHALRSIASGEMTVARPDGSKMRLKYRSHIEHTDGNWTWIGEEVGGGQGQTAMITFGEKAVFGSLPSKKGMPYQLTMVGGRAYVMDPSTLNQVANAPMNAEDAAIEKSIASAVDKKVFVDKKRLAAGGAQVAEATTSQTTTVDLLVGYTNGFADRLGGDSQALTRLNFMVDFGNMVLDNSQVDGKVRMVKAMRVNYADDTNNRGALYALSGLSCTFTQSGGQPLPEGGANCTAAARPAELQALANAREIWSADLVTLVRTLNVPENGSCGVAWLNGGGQAPLLESRGFSVISDSSGDTFPDNGNICRNETLIHELGHNMGLQHDTTAAAGTDDSNTDGNNLDPDEFGRHAYSFDMVTDASNGNFTTVMGIRTGTTTSAYLTLSNPRSTFCGGRACGINGVADNALSLSQSLPLVAAFRSPLMVTGAGIRRDFNGDGKGELLMVKDGILCFLFMNGTAVSSSACPASAGPQYHLVGTGDFDGDNKSDLLWTNGTWLKMWFGNGAGNVSTQEVGGYDATWTMAATVDMNGDNKTDILMTKEGVLCVLFMNGTALTSVSCPAAAGPDYRIATTGDFNGDHKSDVLWTNGNYVKMWFGNGAGAFDTQEVGNYDGSWTMASTSDMNNDGRSDILMTKDGILCILYMNGTTLTSVSCPNSATAGYHLVTPGDYNGDGRPDIVWTNGWYLRMWFGNGAGGLDTQEVGSYDGSWVMY